MMTGGGAMSRAMADPLLAVSHVSRHFGGVQAVADVSLVIGRGESLGVIGPNGAGKSTLLSLVAGALRPDSGSIRFDGEEIAGLPSHKIGSRGLIRTFQVSSEFPRLTVLQNLLVARPRQLGERFVSLVRRKRAWAEEEERAVARARDLLARFRLAEMENEYAGNLSGGQRRLLEVARALMAEPKLLLLDEPTAGVLPKMIAEVREQLRSVRDDGVGMLMIEHELGTIEEVCERVVVMARGSVIAEGGLAEVRELPEVKDAYVAG